jgi:shikimate 5-dehydrogenase
MIRHDAVQGRGVRACRRKASAARLAGAANALKFDEDRVVADNFDGVGLLNDIQRNLNVALARQARAGAGCGRAPRGARCCRSSRNSRPTSRSATA